MIVKTVGVSETKAKMRTIIIGMVVVLMCINVNVNAEPSPVVKLERNVTCGDSTYPRYQQVVSVISSPRQTNWGVWGDWDFCPPCSTARSFEIRVQPRQFEKDDSALNAIKLICSDSTSTEITSLQGKQGDWVAKVDGNACPKRSRISGADIRIKKPRKSGDDTSVNDINFKCTYGLVSTVSTLNGRGGPRGKWFRIPSCPKRSYICGLRTQVETFEGPADDTGLNNVDFACCTIFYRSSG